MCVYVGVSVCVCVCVGGGGGGGGGVCVLVCKVIDFHSRISNAHIPGSFGLNTDDITKGDKSLKRLQVIVSNQGPYLLESN